jgi:Cof subfamily protein (haloacid dehalogenase superfamily)
MPHRTNPPSVRRPRLLAVDLDGTLLDALTQQPHEEDRDALLRLAESGSIVTIVTGRLYSGTRPSAEALLLEGPVACADGSHMVRTKDHATLLHHGVPSDALARLRTAITEHEPATFVFAEQQILHDHRGTAYLDYVKNWSTDLRATPEITEHDAWTRPDRITALVAFGTQEQIAGIVDPLEKTTEGTQFARFALKQIPGMWAMIARAKVGTKATALSWLADHHGIAMDETVCVGDWHNDVPMLEVAGRAYVMGQAPDEVKAAGTHVLEETNATGGGIARIVKDVFGV